MLIADTHVHIYPAYQAAAMLEKAYLNLKNCGNRPKQFHAGLFLAERDDCHVFQNFAGNKNIPEGFHLEKTSEQEALLLVNPSNNIRIFLFAGCQVNTSEGIELLSLVSGSRIPSGKSAAETLTAIRQAGGIPVLSWAPGKWLFKRGQLLKTLIESQNGETFLIGDTSMRARGLSEPKLMKLARSHKIPVIAGTDPLPFAGDEFITGSFGISSKAFDPDQPVTSARKLLREGTFIIAGQRNSLSRSVTRWRTFHSKKAAG